MNDLRRTLLWSVFAVSLLMLWDGWLRHTGQPSLFAPAPVASVAAPAASGASGASAADVPQSAQALGGAAGAAAAQVAAGASAPATAQGEQVVLTTDVVKATVDTLGASLVRLAGSHVGPLLGRAAVGVADDVGRWLVATLSPR